MAGGEELDSIELQNRDCSFVWDPQTHLYFHASSGFYHDPHAGWYYNSRDGLYYKFENGNYVLLDFHKDKPCANVYYDGEECQSSSQGSVVNACDIVVNVADESTTAGAGRDEMYEMEEGEWIPEENHGLADSSEVVPYEGDTLDEENWRAQYGQVTQSKEELVPKFPVEPEFT